MRLTSPLRAYVSFTRNISVCCIFIRRSFKEVCSILQVGLLKILTSVVELSASATIFRCDGCHRTGLIYTWAKPRDLLLCTSKRIAYIDDDCIFFTLVYVVPARSQVSLMELLPVSHRDGESWWAVLWFTDFPHSFQEWE